MCSSSPASLDEVIITIVRHGETSYNHSKTVQGHLDVPLNTQGLAQASTTGRVLAARGCKGFDQAWSSDLSRAKVTARTILDKAGFERMSVREDERLRERFLGTMQNKRRGECTAADSKTIEPTSEFAGRLLSFWDERFPFTPTSTATSNGSTAAHGMNEEGSSSASPRQWLIVSHGGSIRQLLHSLLINRSSNYFLSPTEFSDPLDQVLDRRIRNCCFTEIRMRRGEEGWLGVVYKYADEGHFEDDPRAPSPGRNEDVVE
ncbi:BQ5605_C005g03384 [Microbotryum silenes-dioicae]|uniref:BQ5605_C005g03384 protein n=1 Tax=Microbotryum silenes-dioicae TaxID=796604 RepID=A0A2X0MXM1_9BASI|nr:BQ5605_C005g03384 [Microbotryum silenes-dioicae]